MKTNLSENMQGAIFMSICMAAFGINDALMKLSSQDFHLFQAIFLRSLISTAFLGIYAWKQRAFMIGVPKSERKFVIMRTVGEIGGAFMFLNAIFHMPIANASAIMQSMPLAITLGAAIFLKEPVGWRRYLAVSIGFAGVMIIVRPGSDGFNEYSLFALGSIVLIVLRDLSTRKISRTVPSSMISFYTSVGITLASAVTLPFIEWTPVTLSNGAPLVAAAMFLIVGYVLSVSSMRVGDIGFVSPFRYMILLWSIILGIFMFDNIPDIWTIVGSTIIVATGVYTFYREQQVARSQKNAARSAASRGIVIPGERGKRI